MRRYFYQLLARYLALHVRPDDRLVELDPLDRHLVANFPNAATVEGAGQLKAATEDDRPDYVLISGRLHYERDIQTYLESVRGALGDSTRLLVIYYSGLWRPLFGLATRLGWRTRTPEVNWLSHGDVANLLRLADFEVVRRDPKILVPFYLPLLGAFANRYLAPLPFFSSFCVANLLVARPAPRPGAVLPSVSVVVPARNEAGNIAQIVARLPKMGPDDELIFIEGGSRDDTWEKILEVQRIQGPSLRIVADRQDGKGKGDAVRKGFALARNDVLMILDADITVPPEDLPKFYAALTSGKGEFINGSRLVYPMEKGAMRFANLLGNKFFAVAFSFMLGQRFKDTLCGTKVLTRQNYLRLAKNRSYFGDFDPFGDFDLIFGAARMGLRIVEVPIVYRERTYGETNISRWRHGAILLRMLVFAARRMRFI